MYMHTGELKSHKHDTISLLEIVSMEGRYYMARFYLDGQGYVLTDNHDKVVMFTGASAVKEFFHDYQVDDTVVLPPTGTDEMIGMPDSGSETMRVPL
ncbi:DUF6482 family protein [Marinobacter orientalis]|uniref:Uncharacterized protein n=1 Tax=Marinobacter orientalis TaxID=1928859 RepID=A0A7Y0NLL6_9GAMM|nr:DUF6482 family protein [Marinobacter orientalis]NMT62768.1 hypothetical protein [Marinobacter orientalis]TGX51448.1 hypothetical protein DIT72_05330 [Marinobacter orientalis]